MPESNGPWFKLSLTSPTRLLTIHFGELSDVTSEDATWMRGPFIVPWDVFEVQINKHKIEFSEVQTITGI